MRTQYRNSAGEVILSKWWKTPSAQASFRRVAKANRERFTKLQEQKQAQAKLMPGTTSAQMLKRRIKRK